MANMRKKTYATAYTFGTDGSAALANDPLAAPHKHTIPGGMQRRKAAYEPVPARFVWRAPLWLAIVCVATLVFIASFALLGARSGMTQAAKKKAELSVELARAQEVVASLEVNINQKNDPERIHSVAVNRLGMRMPQEGQVRVLSRPQPLPSGGNDVAIAPEEGGFLRLLLSLVGL